MRIALVFSGVPRHIEFSRLNIRDKLIQNHDVDVFSYVWKMHEYEYVQYAYNHTVLQIVDTSIVESFPSSEYNVYSHWFGKQLACRSFKTFVQSTSRVYDMVVRTRHDVFFYHKIDFSSLNPSLLNVCLKHWNGHPTPIFDDNLMITNQSNYINFYENLFDWYMNKKDRNHEDVSEERLTQYTFENKLFDKVTKNAMLDFELTKHIR